MNILYQLTKDDIRDIIAAHFKVIRKDVDLQITETYVGYGPTEHKDYVIECSVNIQKQTDITR